MVPVSTGLMVVKAIQHCDIQSFYATNYFRINACVCPFKVRVSRSPLMTTICHDGLLYFACILATTIANLIVIAHAPEELNASLIEVQRVLHSALCSRVLLNIRSAYETQKRRCSGEDSMPNVEFMEQLDHSLWPSDQHRFQPGVGDHVAFG
ncbi:hypothetical protein BD410DRAFT_632792 [Rickenella mellea]|uniref:Uncharacterized protein n=1 Tax=Rickenella mellea TaxID=50990 RepID=A0A4Y7QEE8_9AGAM|nr:hypothetical protein BD410DRAFT_632792 [Rickenella mellea]